MLVQAQPVLINDFSGGLDTKSSPLKIPANKSPAVLNCHTNTRYALVARNGFTELNTNTESGNQNGLYEFQKDQTTRMLMQFRGAALYKMDSLDGTWDSVTLGAAVTNAVSEFDVFDLGTGSNRLIIANASGTDRLQYWDGSGSTTQITDADSGYPRYAKVWYQRVWTIGDNADPNNLKWSDAGSVTAWTAANNTDIITNDGDFPTGMALLKKSLYVFKKYSIHRVTYTGGDPLTDISPVITGTGCVSSRTIKNVNIPDLGEALVFLTADGRVCAFTGHSEGLTTLSDDISLNNGISPISMAQLNSTYLSVAHATIIPNKFWYIIFVPVGTTTCNYALVFDYLNKSWWPWSNMNFGSSALVYVNNAPRIYAQGSTHTYRLDSGNNDNGDSISRYWVSPKITRSAAVAYSSQYGAQFTFKAIGNYNASEAHRMDWDSSWSSAVSMSMLGDGDVLGDDLPIILGGQESVTRYIDVAHHGNLIQYKVSTNNTDPPWTLYSVEDMASTRGLKP